MTTCTAEMGSNRLNKYENTRSYHQLPTFVTLFQNNASLALPPCIVLFERESYASRAFPITFSKLLEDLKTVFEVKQMLSEKLINAIKTKGI